MVCQRWKRSRNQRRIPMCAENCRKDRDTKRERERALHCTALGCSEEPTMWACNNKLAARTDEGSYSILPTYLPSFLLTTVYASVVTTLVHLPFWHLLGQYLIFFHFFHSCNNNKNSLKFWDSNKNFQYLIFFPFFFIPEIAIRISWNSDTFKDLGHVDLDY